MADSKQLSKEKKATSEVQKICKEVNDKAEKKTETRYCVFRAKSYKTLETEDPPETLFIKDKVDRDEYVHLRVQETRTYWLYFIQTGKIQKFEDIRTAKSLGDPIEFF